MASGIHPLLETLDKLLDDLETVGHRRRADLHIAGAKGDELRRVAPSGHAADARDRNVGRFRITRNGCHHIQGDRLDRRTAISAMCSLAVDGRLRGHLVEIDRYDRADGVDQRHGIGTAGLCGTRRIAHIRDVRRQLHDHRHAGVRLGPAGDHLDIFGDLADSGAHAALGHAVRTAEIQLHPVAFGVFHLAQDIFPARLLARHHQAGHQRPVRPGALYRLDFLKVYIQRPVGDQLDVVQPEQAPVRAPDRAVAWPADIDDMRIETERLPHDTAPAGLEGADDIIFLVGRRRRSQPEGIRGFDAYEVVSQVSHCVLPFCIRRGASVRRSAPHGLILPRRAPAPPR